jgi:uncharacterized membrane protein YcaP (DUF421 family)
MLFNVDFSGMFIPTQSLVEMFLRGTLVYVGLLMLMRSMRREAGGLALSDILFIIILADAAQNAMSSDYKSITEGAVLVGAIAFWNYFFDWLSFNWPAFEKFMRPDSMMLIRDGRVLHENRRREMVTMGELLSELREQGIKSPTEVKECRLEGDGHISVIKFETGEEGKDDAPSAKSKGQEASGTR